MPYLAFNLNDGNEFVFDLLDERLSLGRDAKNDIVIDNGFISGFHAEFLKQSDGTYEMVDLKSSNGTFLNGKRVERTRLRGGDRVQFGQLEARFRDRAPKGLAPADNAKAASSTATGAGKGLPTRPDGRRGDTESVPTSAPRVPAPPANSTKPFAPAGGPVEKTSDIALPSRVVPQPATPPSTVPVSREDPAKLKLELERLRDEIAAETRRRDEVIAVSSLLDSRKKELADLDAKLTASRKPNDPLANTQKDLSTAQAELAKARAELATTQKQTKEQAALAAQMATLKKDIEQAQVRFNGLQREADDKSVALQKKVAEEKQAAEKLSRINGEIAAAESVLAETKTTAESAQQAARQKLEADQKQAAETLAKTVADLAAAESSLASTRQQLDAEKSLATKSASEQLAALTKDIAAAEARLTSLQKESEAAQSAAEQKTAEEKRASEQLIKLQQELADTHRQLEAEKAETAQITGTKEDAIDTTAALAALGLQRDQLESELAKLRASFEAEQQRAKDLQQQSDDTAAKRRSEAEAEAARLAEIRAEAAALNKAIGDKQAEFEVLSRQHSDQLGDLTVRVQALQEHENTLAQKLREVAGGENQFGNVTDAIKALEEKHLTVAAQKATLGASILSMKNQQREAEQELEVLKELGSAQRSLVNTLSKRREEAETAARQVEAQLEAAKNSLSATQEQSAEVEATLLKQRQETEKLTKQISDGYLDLQKTTAELQASTKELQTTKADAEKSSAELATLVSQVAQKQDQLTDLEARLTESKNDHAQVTASHASLLTAVAALTSEHADHSDKLSLARASLAEVESQLAAQRAALETVTSQAAELTQHNEALDARLFEFADTEAKLAKAKAELDKSTSEIAVLRPELEQLTSSKLAEEKALGVVNDELKTASAELEKARSEHADLVAASKSAQIALGEAERAAQSLRSEAANLETLIKDNRASLDADVTAKLNEAKAAEAKLSEVLAKIASAEQRLAELADLERKVADATEKLTEANSQRLAEEQTMAGLVKQQDLARTDLATLATEATMLRATADEHASRAEAETARIAEAEKRLQAVEASIATAEADTATTQAALDEIRTEDKRLREEVVPRHVSEIAALTAAIAGLVAQRDDHTRSIQELTASTDIEVKTRAQQLEALQAQEARLGQALASKQEEIRALEIDLNAKLDQVQAADRTLQELVGTKALTLAEAVKELEGRQREATRAVREASEQDLALQAKLTTLQETISRESQRVERIKRDATFAEEQSRLAAADAEGRIAEFTRMEQEAITRAEAARRDLVKLEPKQHELAAADAQLRQFQEIERRLRSQLEELEEKHEVMRRGLPTDEATVMLFANDLIKRIDLIDILIQRYASEGGGVDQQLRTLRAAFEDILHQHSVIEFDVAANTEIDVSLRQRIAVIESEPGDAKPRIVASFRPGFVYAPAEGREVVLRKVEVKTSSR